MAAEQQEKEVLAARPYIAAIFCRRSLLTRIERWLVSVTRSPNFHSLDVFITAKGSFYITGYTTGPQDAIGVHLGQHSNRNKAVGHVED
ncbi:hypothetical protein BST61_g11518 [Cercospora zeina]